MQIWYLFTALICATALVGDKLVENFPRAELKAVADSSTHGLIGAFSWAATLSNLHSKRYTLTGRKIVDICLCGLIASIIDLDHFYAAGSFSLEAATSLDRRPPLHCTSLWLLLLSSAFIVSVVLKLEWLTALTWITEVAVLSHHIRDATRRGLWMWPFGSTPPIPYYGYVILLCILPPLTSYLLQLQTSVAYTQIVSTV